MAHLRFAAGTMEVGPPRQLKPRQSPVTLNIVHVTEIDTPVGEQPIEWILYTNEPIATPALDWKRNNSGVLTPWFGDVGSMFTR